MRIRKKGFPWPESNLQFKFFGMTSIVSMNWSIILLQAYNDSTIYLYHLIFHLSVTIRLGIWNIEEFWYIKYIHNKIVFANW